MFTGCDRLVNGVPDKVLSLGCLNCALREHRSVS